MAKKIVNPDSERGAAAEPRIPKPDPGTEEKPNPQAPTKTDNESGGSE